MASFRPDLLLFALSGLLILIPFADRAPAADEPNPIIARVKAAVKDPAKPFTMLVHLQVKEGEGKKLEAAFAKAIKPSLKEKGCLAYDLSKDPKKPDNYLVYERWKNLTALEKHLKASHITTLLMEIGELLVMPPKSDIFVPVGD
jgi:quinol monooxygenase YgiN